MALAAVKVTIGQALNDGGVYGVAIKGSSVPGLAAVVTDTATLVADGASPTQGHVTTLNTDVTALNTALAGDVVLMWDGSTVTNRRQLRSALLLALQMIDGGYGALSA
jgi:hypothetical protein